MRVLPAHVATVAAFLTVGAIIASPAQTVQRYRSPEARRAELCGVLMTRASEATARANRLRADQSRDRTRIGDYDTQASSTRDEYAALCK